MVAVLLLTASPISGVEKTWEAAARYIPPAFMMSCIICRWADIKSDASTAQFCGDSHELDRRQIHPGKMIEINPHRPVPTTHDIIAPVEPRLLGAFGGTVSRG
ncbi:hypothetical protein TomTYG75_08740 [Sphingobium sp. TomTYG75]